MSTSFETRIPGRLAYLPVAVRLVRELAAVSDGPGEEEIEPLLPPLESLFERLLTGLENDSRDLETWISPGPGTFVLRVRVAAGPAILTQDDPAVAGLQDPFDRVHLDERPDGSLEITVSSGFNS